MSLSTTEDKLAAFREKMAGAGQSDLAIDTFAHYYRKLVKGETGMLSDREIRPVMPEELASRDRLDDFSDAGARAREQTVHIVLNGGLGTSMGLTGPKSLIRVKEGRSFLEIILRQAQRGAVRLALMNSFNTRAATENALAARQADDSVLMFLQHKFPKILQEDLAPATWPANRDLEWNPPGHGDVYLALHESGLLEKMLDDGLLYAFISNCDNLGARIEPALLGYFAAGDFPFMMEVAEKTPADVKGGHLARLRDGRLVLREAAQCPEEEIDAFRDIRRYRFFNTNNIWVRLDRIQELVRRKGIVDLPMIVNPKTLDPRDGDSPPVFQIESAMGAAVSLFDEAAAVRVPRSRFFPVKTTNDLLAVRSDLFEYSLEGGLKIHSGRGGGDVVKVSLDPRYYKKIDQMEKRFPQGPPSLVDCQSFEVEGDVLFEENVTARGKVKIANTGGGQAVVKAGTVVEADLVL